MANKNPDCYHLSASSISAFKACPTRYRLGYREGLRKSEDTDAQRIGTNWHALHEVYHNAYTEEIKRLHAEVDAGGGDDMLPDRAHEQALDAALSYLNQVYADTPMPSSKTVEQWDTERYSLIMSFIGYLWYWQDDEVEVLTSELPFDLPLHAPRTGMPLPIKEVIRVGKIDHIVAWQRVIGPFERKSTSRSIDPSSDYWDKAKKDTQVSMYALALRDMKQAGELPDAVKTRVVAGTFGNTVYDAFHKPTIQPKNLTQADTADFLETGKYMDTDFEAVIETEVVIETKELKSGNKQIEHTVPTSITVDGEPATFEVSKTFKPVIRETPAMFGARLLQDIYERPEFYFQRKEIARTDEDLRLFRTELFNIYQAQKLYSSNDCWFENEQQCQATFRCQYIPVCYGPGSRKTCDDGLTPDGFERIFVDLTVGGDDLTEGD